jgi:hypothetical protein
MFILLRYSKGSLQTVGHVLSEGLGSSQCLSSAEALRANACATSIALTCSIQSRNVLCGLTPPIVEYTEV